MKLKSITAMLLLGFVLFSLPIFPYLGQTTSPQKDPVNTRPPQNGSRTDEPMVAPTSHGPRSDLDFLFYASDVHCYVALKAGNVDIMCWPLDYAQKLDAEDDPNIQLAEYCGNDIIQFDLNNNETILDFPDVLSPTSIQEFRQAIAFAIDKEFIINFILMGFGERIDVPIPYQHSSWWNTSVTGANYPYKYNMTKADELLTSIGFEDIDMDGIRNYPPDWPGRPGRPNMDPIKLCARTDHMAKYDVAMYLRDQLEILEIPVDLVAATIDGLRPIVMGDRNYHIYTSQWHGVKRFPPIYLFNLFHSMFWFPDGSNYVVPDNIYDTDEILEDMYYTDNLTTAMMSAQRWQGVFMDYCIKIPLWSPRSFVAWRKEVVGVVNMKGHGLNNKYTYLNAYNVLGGPVRVGLPFGPNKLNVLYSSGYSDLQVLNTIYPHLLNVNPYDPYRTQPWVAQDWRVGSWVDPQDGLFKTKATYYIRQDVGMVDPTGTYMRNYTAHDVEFSIWYIHAFNDSYHWHEVMNVHHTNITDDYTIEVYFNDKSMWLPYALGEQLPILAKTELIDILCTTSSVNFDGPISAGTQFKLPTTDQIVQVTSENLPVDFHIFGGYEDYEHNWIWILNDLPAGTYTINYYTPELDPHGYYLAGLPWTATWCSAGLYYPIAISEGVGGYAVFNKNPFFFLETPILGEIDWYWHWIRGFKPRDGYFKISMRDVVLVTGAYGHFGNGPYDPDYFPGADIDMTDLCYVGIYDVAQVTFHYNETFGSPPPNPPPPPHFQYYTPEEVGPLVYVNPQVIPWTVAGPGEDFTISVNIFNLTAGNYAPDPEDPAVMRPLGNLYGLDIIFIWDPTVLEYVSHEVTIPVETYPDGILHGPVWILADYVDPIAGKYYIRYSSESPASPFNNPVQSNMVFNMTFKVIQEGGSELMFIWIELPDKDGKAILFDEQNGIFTIPGDVNGDRIVDIFDIGYISAHWYPGPPIGPLGYHRNADINLDGAVDIFDIGITSAHWGQSW